MRVNVLRLLNTIVLFLTLTAHCCAQPVATLSLEDASSRGPAVASVLEMPRETPAQKLQAVFTLLDLGQPDVAAMLWKEVSSLDLDEQAQANLVGKFGTARFLSLAQRETEDQLVGARVFAEGCMAAAHKRGRDPKRLAKLIKNLSSDSKEERQIARHDLAVTGEAGAVACLEALARANSEQLRTELLLTLAKLRPGVEPILLSAIAEGRGQFRRDAVELAGYLYLQDAVPWLAAFASGADQEPTVASAAYAALTKMGLPLPSFADARATILSSIRRLESVQLPELTDDSWWSYDPEQKRLTRRTVNASEKRLLRLGRLSRLLSTLPGATSSDRRVTLIYAYEISRLLEQPLPSGLQSIADNLSIQELNETLHQAIRNNQLTAAIAAAKILGNRADAIALQSNDGRPGPLAQALAHGNQDLRFAALEAVMKIAPQQSFAGASGVAPSLWSFATGSGAPQVVVASSVVGKAQDWAGQLRAMGFEALPAATGREALRLAFASPRLELMLIDSDIGRPLIREVVYQLRNQNKTTQVPIGILSSLPSLPRARHLAENESKILATPRPYEATSLEKVVQQVRELGPAMPSTEVRSARAQAALGWLTVLFTKQPPSGPLYDELLRDREVISQTLYNPELSDASLNLLEVLGTSDSQLLLVNYASSEALPLAKRQKAAAALDKSTKRFGKLLTTSQILRQYDRYNASENADPETQQLLSQILDSLEKK